MPDCGACGCRRRQPAVCGGCSDAHPEGLAQWLPTQKLAADLSLEEAAALPEVHAEIQQYVDRANADVSRAESVRKFIVLPVQFTQDNKCLTPSMKVVRPKVNEVFAREIDKEIYGR